MYEAKQNKENVSRRIDWGGKANQRMKMMDGWKSVAIQMRCNCVSEILPRKVNVVIQKRDVRKEPEKGNPRFLRYDINPIDGRAYIVENVNVFDNGTPFDGGSPGITYVQGYNNLRRNLWVRFHILNQFLGGPGDNPGNLIPTRQADNMNSSWRDTEEEMKLIASRKPGLFFRAKVNYYAGSIYPSDLSVCYGYIGLESEAQTKDMHFDPPTAEDFEYPSIVNSMVDILARHKKKERDQILMKWKQSGFLLPDAEDYERERAYRSLRLRVKFRQQV